MNKKARLTRDGEGFSDPDDGTRRMTSSAKQQSTPEQDVAAKLEGEVDGLLEACGGDAREAIRALITFGHEQTAHVAALRSAVSYGFARGRLTL